MEKLKSQESVKTIIILAIILISTVGFVLGLRAVLKNEFPLMVVFSESMIPTLNVGDIIVIQGGLNADEITVAPAPNGDIIVFREPGDPNDFIVHRAIDKASGGFVTKGDNNPYPDRDPVPENNIIGKVIYRIPLLGYLFLFLRTPLGLIVFITLILIFMFQEHIFQRKEKIKNQNHNN